MNLELKLTRHDDSVVTMLFRRRMNNTFLYRYVDSINPRTVWVCEKSNEDVEWYIETMCMFKHFKKIVVNIPGTPELVVNDDVHDILQLVHTYIYNPPTSFTV